MRTRIAVLLVVFVLLLLGGSVLAAQGIPRTPIEWSDWTCMALRDN